MGTLSTLTSFLLLSFAVTTSAFGISDGPGNINPIGFNSGVGFYHEELLCTNCSTSLQELRDAKNSFIKEERNRADALNAVVILAHEGTENLDKGVLLCSNKATCQERLIQMKEVYVKKIADNKINYERDFVKAQNVIDLMNKLEKDMASSSDQNELRRIWLANNDLRYTLISALSHIDYIYASYSNIKRSVMIPDRNGKEVLTTASAFRQLDVFFGDTLKNVAVDELTTMELSYSSLVIRSRKHKIDSKTCPKLKFTSRNWLPVLEIDLFGNRKDLSRKSVQDYLNRDEAETIKCAKVSSLEGQGSYDPDKNVVTIPFISNLHFGMAEAWLIIDGIRLYQTYNIKNYIFE